MPAAARKAGGREERQKKQRKTREKRKAINKAFQPIFQENPKTNIFILLDLDFIFHKLLRENSFWSFKKEEDDDFGKRFWSL